MFQNVMKISLLMLLPVAMTLTSCWEKPAPKHFTRPVKLSQVNALGSYDKDFVGVVTAEQYTNLAFRVSGLVNKTYITEGSYVTKGQLLASLDPEDAALQMESDKAQYQTSKSILERNERLLARQAISTQDVEIARANFLKAKSAYEYSNNQLLYTKLYAPFSGSIEKKLVEDYQKISAGTTVFKLINPNELEVKFTLPDNDANITQVQARYAVEFENLRGESFEAKIKEVVDASVDGAGIPVTLSITDPKFDAKKLNIKAGFACRIKIKIENRPMLQPYMTVPMTAIFSQENDNTSKYVWLFDQATSTVEKRRVTVDGLTGSDLVIIKDGLTKGDMVVTAGVYQLVDNQTVTILAQ